MSKKSDLREQTTFRKKFITGVAEFEGAAPLDDYLVNEIFATGIEIWNAEKVRSAKEVEKKALGQKTRRKKSPNYHGRDIQYKGAKLLIDGLKTERDCWTAVSPDHLGVATVDKLLELVMSLQKRAKAPESWKPQDYLRSNIERAYSRRTGALPYPSKATLKEVAILVDDLLALKIGEETIRKAFYHDARPLLLKPGVTNLERWELNPTRQ
jgi:hypothetical protein